MEDWMAPSEIAAVFAEEIKSAGGIVTDVFEDEGLTFARSVLPEFVEVAPRDRLQPGIAIRATDADILVHPYIFRLVCSNGAIMVRARHLVREGWFLDDQADTDLETTLRVAIRQCCHREAYTAPIEKMRSAADTAADMAITFSAFMSTHRGAISRTAMRDILLRYGQSHDRSKYGLINAITSVARDTRDPNMKWRLEELGGEIAYEQARRPRTPRAATMRSLAAST
jgi:hypothetical protein